MNRDIDASLAALRERWPGLALEDEACRAVVAENSESPHLGDMVLAWACLAGQRAALDHLEREVFAHIDEWLRGVEPEQHVRDEVCQRVRERTLIGPPPRIAQYKGKGPLAAWVRVVSLREHATLRRDRLPDGERWADIVATSAVLSPELAVLRSRYLPLLNEALRHGLSSLPARERTLFRLHYVDGLSFERIGTILHVDKSTVSRRLGAARGQVLAAAKELVAERLGATHADAESLFDLLRSQLEMQLSPVARVPA